MVELSDSAGKTFCNHRQVELTFGMDLLVWCLTFLI